MLQHAPPSLRFDKFEELEALAESIRNDEVHVPKESLVLGVNRLDCKSKFNVIPAWPTCSKDYYQGTYEMVYSTSKEYKALAGKSLMNFCTDGDLARRV